MKKNSMSVNNYISHLVSMADELRDARVAIDEGELVMIALNVLDASYDPFVTTQMAQFDHIYFATIQGLLHNHDDRMNWMVDSRVFALVNYVHKITQHGEPLICHICTKFGHDALSCFNRHNENKFPSMNDRDKLRFQKGANKSLVPLLKGI